MIKKTIYIILIFSLIFQLGCGKQDYKRITIEEDVGLERETLIEKSISGQIYLEIDSKDYFYPSFYHGGYIYGHIKRTNGNDPYDRKYLYKIDLNNKLTETIKENINSLQGPNPVDFIDDQVYAIDYTRRNNLKQIPELSNILNIHRENKEDYQYEISYASGSDNYLVIHELSKKSKLMNIYLYDIELEEFYIKEHDNRHGDICYVEYLKSLIWIDQKDFKIYKVLLKDGFYTLEEYIDLGVDKDINRVRGIMKNNFEIILLHDSRLSNNDEWNLMETCAITSYHFRTDKHVHLFKKPIDENLYIEYLGQNIFIVETFDIFKDYIEITKRRLYYCNYKELNMVYNEEFQEKSQELYPEIRVVTNKDGDEIFSTREIKKIINGIPTTKSVTYQRIKLFVPRRGSS